MYKQHQTKNLNKHNMCKALHVEAQYVKHCRI